MILVTGGTGLLGTHLLFELVSSGKKVRALKRENSSMELLNKVFGYYTSNASAMLDMIEWVNGDVRDIYTLYEAMEGVERVYHAAAVVSFDGCDADEMMRVNVEGTANVVNACIYKGVEKICHVSSIASLGQSDNDELISEETKWKNSNKNSAYAISKFGAEREVWRGTIEGLPAVIVNPGIIIGPGSRGKGSSRLFDLVWKGLKFYTTGVNGYVDVRDVVKAMIKMMDSETINTRMIVSAENISYEEFFGMVAEGLGKKAPRIKAGRILGHVAWRAEKIKWMFTGKKALISKETARTALKKSFYSNEKIKNNLGFEFIPMRVSIEENCGWFLKEMLDVTPDP